MKTDAHPHTGIAYYLFAAFMVHGYFESAIDFKSESVTPNSANPLVFDVNICSTAY